MIFAPVLLLALSVSVAASSPHAHGAHVAHRRRQLNLRGELPLNATTISKRANRRASCKAKSSTTHSASSTVAKAASSTAKSNPTSTSKSSSGSSSSGSSSSGSSSSGSSSSGSSSSGSSSSGSSSSGSSSSGSSSSGSGSNQAVAAGDFTPTRPADWPSQTQSGEQPAYTVATSQDPYLEILSKAIDYSNYDVFNAVNEGDMTYYGQGLGACGDVYDDNSFTAAVSQLMFDAWLGADTNAQNRNPICGPFVPGRQSLNSAGLFVTSVKSSIAGHAVVGGDGLINCVGSADVQCHIPMTATVTHGNKSIQVKIVDRCEGCKHGDIDLTPAAFAALADPALGRTSVKWQFNKW